MARVTGAAADWLESRPSELNQRFERARRRFPSLSPDSVLAALAEVLVPLAGPEPSSGDLLSAMYDLVLLHAGRETFAVRPGVDLLLKKVFPAIRPLLLERPSVLPGALSNAVENMGPRGLALAETVGRMSGHIDRSDVLLDAVAVAAWRLGEARLREQALAIAARLPPAVLLEALALADFPEGAAPLVVGSLHANGWRHPRKLFSDQTMRALREARPGLIDSLQRKIAGEAPAPPRTWIPIAKVGDFAGFDGSFDSPPLLLDGGDRHLLFARAGEHDFRIDADIFGWVCRPHPRIDRPLRTGKGNRAQVPSLAGATSYVELPRLVAATHIDSHRIRILSPPDEPL